jgi:broad specificity phosphatase PhoE
MAAAQPALVIVVRHAEAASAPGGDPPLTPEGAQRAQALAELLADAGVTQIVSTQFRRTLDTAGPTARRFGIEPQVVAARRGEGAAHVPEVVEAVRRLGGVVLVVGHSNTVGAIVAGLAGKPVTPLCETSHAPLFVLGPQAASGALLRLHYGAPDPPPGPGCQ